MEQNNSMSIAKAKALSSPTRVDILKLLKKQQHTLSEISRELKISKTNAKAHLAKLLAVGLVGETSRSKWKYYSLSEEHKNSGAVYFSIPLVSLFLSIVSLYAALQNTTSVVSPDHEYSVFLSFTQVGWMYFIFGLALGTAFLVSLVFLLLKRK